MLEALHFLDGTAKLVLVDLERLSRAVATALQRTPSSEESLGAEASFDNEQCEIFGRSLSQSSEQYEMHSGPAFVLCALMLPMARLTEGQNAVGGTRAR